MAGGRMGGLIGWLLGSFARQHGKDKTLKLLTSELEKLDTSIDTVSGCWLGGWLAWWEGWSVGWWVSEWMGG